MFARSSLLRKIARQLPASNGLMSSPLKAQASLPRIGAHGIFKRGIAFKSELIIWTEKEKPLSASQQYEHICRMYTKLHDQLSVVMERARISNKKILITIGESRTDKRSLIIQLLMMNLILRNNLSKTLLLSVPRFILDLVKTEAPKCPADDINVRYLQYIAGQEKFSVTPIDTVPFENDNNKWQAFKKAILAVKQDAFFVTDIENLSLVHEDRQIQEKFESLPINAANLSFDRFKAELSSSYGSSLLKVHEEKSPYLQGSLSSTCLSMNAEKIIKLCNDMRSLNPEISRVQALDEEVPKPGVFVQKLGRR